MTLSGKSKKNEESKTGDSFNLKIIEDCLVTSWIRLQLAN